MRLQKRRLQTSSVSIICTGAMCIISATVATKALPDTTIRVRVQRYDIYLILARDICGFCLKIDCENINHFLLMTKISDFCKFRH